MPTDGFDKKATNLCKGMAIILMYMHHCFYQKAAFAGTAVIFAPFTRQQTMAAARLCKVCVAVFVFLSAFGVYRSAGRKNAFTGEFFRERYCPLALRRFRALLWNFVVIYVLSQLCSPLIGISRVSVYGESALRRLLYTVLDGLGVAHFFGTPTYNGTWWYLPFAYLLILLLPVLAAAADYLGYAMLPMAVLLPQLAGFSVKSTFFRYLTAIVLGLLFAKYDLMERAADAMGKSRPRFWLGAAVSFLGFAAMLLCRYKFGREYLFEGFATAFLCLFGYTVLLRLSGISQALAFLGKHSMNMFFIHTLIRGAKSRFHAFSYAPRYPVLIVLLLLADTLALSVAIEYLKRLLRGGSIRLSAVWSRTLRKK